MYESNQPLRTSLHSQNALKTPAMTQFAMNWGLLAGSLLVGLPSLWTMTDTNEDKHVRDEVELGSTGENDSKVKD